MGGTWAFRHMVPLLVAAGHRVIVADPFDPASAPRSAQLSLTMLTDRWAVALRQLGVGKATVVAHSLASSLVLRLAARHPELVGGIVSLEGGMVDRIETPGLRSAAALAPLIRAFGASGIVRRRVRSSLRERSASPGWVTREVVETYSRPLVRDMDRLLSLMRELANAREPTSIADAARTIRVPVVLLLGDARQTAGPGAPEIERMRAALASFSVDTIANAGHFLHEEQPGEVVRQILLVDRKSNPLANKSGDIPTPE